MIKRSQLRAWTGSTWHEMLEKARNKNKLNKKQKYDFIDCCKSLRRRGDYDRLKDSVVTGSISQGWRDLNKAGPLFQKSLVTVATAYPSDWTAAEYALDYFATCIAEGIVWNEIDLGRSLRNLPSFLREYLLLDTLKEAGFDVELPSVEENAHTHVDLVIRLADREVTIWNYLKTPKAVEMLKQKILTRGTIRSGFNLLAPIDNKLETENFHGWYLPTANYIHQLVNAAVSKPKFKRLNVTQIQSKELMEFILFKQP